MENRNIVVVVLGLVILGGLIGGGFLFVNQNQGDEFVIYTYSSLLADPGYDWVSAFAEHAGIENDTIRVVLLDSAGDIVTRAAAEKKSPVADVLIGIDDIQIHKAKDENILTPYKPAGADKLVDGLVNNLSPDYLVTPYDYGVISPWYFKGAPFNTSFEPNQFVLDDMLKPNVESSTIVENPNHSTPGAAFLLHSIAIYGDNQLGIDGVVDKGPDYDWRDYWADLSEDALIEPDWSTSISTLYADSSRNMMVSYSTSPAYNICNFDDNSTEAVLSHENGGNWGWQQIEGLGMVRDTDNEDLAKQFIDWFISQELQSQIYLNQWVYPALASIDQPDCYDDVIDFDSIDALNSKISQSQIANNFDSWLDDWESTVVAGN